MKIMLCTRVTNLHRAGGMPHVVADRASALAAAGHTVEVVTTSIPGLDPMCVPRDYCVSTEAPLGVGSPPQRWTREFSEVCAERYRRFRPDVVHLDSFDRANMWWDGGVDRARCRVAITLHGFGWGAFLTNWNRARRLGDLFPKPNFEDMAAEAAALARADVVIGVSRHEWRMLRDEYGLTQARLVYNPIARCFFDTPPAPRLDAYFLSAAVSGQDTRGFTAAKQACERVGVPFREVRDVPREQMPAVYDGAAALILPTAYGQGYDLAVCEARARGVAAIMSATGSYLSEAEEFDRLVPPLDAGAVERELRTWSAPNRLTVRAVAEERHHPDRHAQAWLRAVAG